jgi:hypothetical protein
MLIPIAISIAKVTRMHYLLASVSVVSGISIGGFSPVSTIGIFIRELADQVGGMVLMQSMHSATWLCYRPHFCFALCLFFHTFF